MLNISVNYLDICWLKIYKICLLVYLVSLLLFSVNAINWDFVKVWSSRSCTWWKGDGCSSCVVMLVMCLLCQIVLGALVSLPWRASPDVQSSWRGTDVVMMAEAPSPDIELKNNNCKLKLVLRLLTINTGSALPTRARFPLVVCSLLLLLFVAGLRLTFLTSTYRDFIFTLLVLSIIVDIRTARPTRVVVGLALNTVM